MRREGGRGEVRKGGEGGGQGGASGQAGGGQGVEDEENVGGQA